MKKVLIDLERIGTRWEYGSRFAVRALTSRPVWSEANLIEIMLGGDIVPFRRAMREIDSRRQPPGWDRKQ